MSLPYSSINIASAQAVDGYTLEPAFDGQNERVIARQTWQQARANYTPLPLDTIEVINGANFYLVEETSLRDLGGGEVQWERVWARIPPVRTEWIAFPYEMPAVEPIRTNGAFANVTVTGAAPLMLITLSNHSFSNGAQVWGRWVLSTSVFTDVFGPVTVVNSSAFQLPFSSAFVSGSNHSIAPYSTSGGRAQPKLMITRAQVDYSYYLPGVSSNIATPLDIPTEPVFEVSLFGVKTNVVTEATVPNTNVWVNYVANQTPLVAEDTFTRWRGNIYERKTVRFIPL